jgi:probable rRNA maturation factor
MPVDLALEGKAQSETGLGRALATQARALLVAAGLKRRELSLVLTDDAHIMALNAQWRGEKKATDVLSFPMDEPERERPRVGPLGDIVISLETTAVEAEKVGFTRDAMATFLLVHGFCHLLGHDHGEPDEAAAMRADEDRFLTAIAGPDAVRPPTPY